MSEDYNPLDTLIEKELLQTSSGISVTVGKEVAPADREQLWNMVHEGFIDLNRRSYDKQDMTYEEFAADLNSADVLKYIARDSTKAPIGLLTVHVGLEGIVWSDTQSLQEEQARLDSRAAPYYVGTLVVPPDMRGTETASYLVKASFIHFKEVNAASGQNSLVFFDCADANYPWLGEFVQRVGTPDAEYPTIQTDVRHLYTEYWVADAAGAHKSREQPTDEQAVLDKQHQYAITIDSTAA